MMQEGLRYFSQIHLSVAGMIVFFVIYLILAVRTLFTRASRFEAKAKLPLLEEDCHEP
jgi:hypothetical protein